jgi:hypothetical protein
MWQPDGNGSTAACYPSALALSGAGSASKHAMKGFTHRLAPRLVE